MIAELLRDRLEEYGVHDIELWRNQNDEVVEIRFKPTDELMEIYQTMPISIVRLVKHIFPEILNYTYEERVNLYYSVEFSFMSPTLELLSSNIQSDRKRLMNEYMENRLINGIDILEDIDLDLSPEEKWIGLMWYCRGEMNDRRRIMKEMDIYE